jgi:hypothetical protein
VWRHDGEQITHRLLPRLVCYHVGAAPSLALKMGGDPPGDAGSPALASLPTRSGFPTWLARFGTYFQISPAHAAAKPRNSFALATSASHFFNCSGVRKRSSPARSSARWDPTALMMSCRVTFGWDFLYSCSLSAAEDRRSWSFVFCYLRGLDPLRCV